MVHIETNPPSEPYPAAIWIGVSCHVSGNTSMVTFNWTYLCSTHNPPTVVLSFTNRINVNETDVIFRSAHTSCQDMMMCNASDLSGNTGFATWRLGRVTGKTITLLYPWTQSACIHYQTDNDRNCPQILIM